MTLIVNLVRPIPDTESFYSKWNRTGETISYLPQDQLDEIDVLILDFNTILDQETIDKMTRLRCVATPTTGLTHLRHLRFNCPVISLFNHPSLKDVKSVSELTLMFMLMLSRPLSTIGNTLNRKTLGIVGVGRIGLQVTRLAHSFGMSVIGYDKGSLSCDLDRLIEHSDFISVHLSENKETKNFVNVKFLSKMKPSACLINTARGSIVDEVALIRALTYKKIKGAALDVIENPKAFNNISGLNLILSSHIGGSTFEDRLLTEDLLFKKVKSFLQLSDKKQI